MIFFSGVQVYIGVDATKLQEHKFLSSKFFNMVVFNFPHVGGKMRIEKNRELLKKFFLSVKSILKTDGKVLVTLCDGQGGTSFDKSMRKWNDSWQITEMAAHGSFNLVGIELFDPSLFENYVVTGYRSLEKEFNTKDSLTHIFMLADEPNINNIAPIQKINLENYYNALEYISWKHAITQTIGLNKINDRNDNLSLYSSHYKFDITFTVTPEFNDVKFFETLYNNAGLIIDEVDFLDHYIGLKETKTFRITYKSEKFPLHRKLVIEIHKNLITDIIEKNFNVTVTR